MQNIKRLIVSLLLAGLVLPILQAQDKNSDEITIAYLYDVSGQHQIKTEWHVSLAVLKRQPQWDGISGNPPLASGAAGTIALQEVKKHFPDITNWNVEIIRLRNLWSEKIISDTNVWCYQITCIPDTESLRSELESKGLDHELTQVILMDKTIVTPVVVEK
jgi:hypothetical protein